jgi:DUF971 family protein
VRPILQPRQAQKESRVPVTIDTVPQAMIEEEGKCLRLVLPSGEALTIEAGVLWSQCPSALRRRQRLDDRVPPVPLGLHIARLTPMGNYALNIAFSDGHDRGVYPWSLLEALARKPKLADFLIPAADAGRAPHVAT